MYDRTTTKTAATENEYKNQQNIQGGAQKTGTLKTRDWQTRDQNAGVENAGLENAGPCGKGWKTRDFKTQDLKSMESLTKHKCRNNVELESKAMAQKHRYQKLRS